MLILQARINIFMDLDTESDTLAFIETESDINFYNSKDKTVIFF